MHKIFLTLIFLSALSWADDHTISVLDFTGEGIHEEELRLLSEQFRIELLKMDTLRVMDYEDMLLILETSGYESPSCNTVSCAVIASMLLDQEWLASAHIAKIGDVFVIEARLFDSHTGRVINVATYDHELSLEGLQTRGMHNLAEILLSTRVPMEVHQRQNLLYIKTKPSGAMVRVGKDTLSGNTPMALDRVLVESRPIIILKNGFQPFIVKQLPEDISDILYIELQHLVPQIGHLSFADPAPEGLVIVSSDGDDRFLVEEGAIEFNELDAGQYHLESGDFIIHKGEFRIRHRRTTQIDPDIYRISDIEKERDRYKLKRNLMIGVLSITVGYRGYLYFESEKIYDQYGSKIEEGDSRHQKIEELDKQKPIFDGLSIAMVFPIIYYHAKYLQMERWLNQ
tara:strand:- start:969 stop:2165 length:1197 start_codon:yes stop_codon:yes gene_type:complete